MFKQWCVIIIGLSGTNLALIGHLLSFDWPLSNRIFVVALLLMLMKKKDIFNQDPQILKKNSVSATCIQFKS